MGKENHLASVQGVSPKSAKGFIAGLKPPSALGLRRLAESSPEPDKAFRLTRIEERGLVAAARAGDRRALDRLLRLLAGPIYRFGRGFCGDPHDAEDVAQVVLAALARTLNEFRGEASLTTWAYTVARHTCARQRRRGVHAPARLVSLESDRAGAAIAVADPAGDPHHALERSELRGAIERAIHALPAAQREVLVLRDVEGLSAREVGKVLRLSERAVKSRLHRARLAVRSALEPHHDGRPLARRSKGCPDTARMVSRFLEGELDAEHCARLEAHVRGCPDCRRACDTLRLALTACRARRRESAPRSVVSAARAKLTGTD